MSKLFKNITFAIGFSWLILGAITYKIQDWDIGVSVILAVYTYLTAEWAVTALLDKQYRKYPVALISALVAPYALYIAYWTLQGKESVMLSGNLYLVTSLYLIYGVSWAFYQKHQQEIDAILPKMAENVRGLVR